MQNRRVVVTGMGVVSPFGVSVPVLWAGLTAGKSGIRRITRFDSTDFASQIAGEVPDAPEPNGFDPAQYLDVKEMRKMDRFIQLGMAAAHEAIAQAGLADLSDEAKLRTGVCVGSGVGGLPQIEETVHTLKERGPRRISPFFIPAILINLLPGHISMRWGFKGMNLSHVSACATGAHAVGEAMLAIRHGRADVMIAGGAESAVCPLSIGGFAAARALSTGFNNDPQRASRPFDKNRDGFVLGEGAAILVLESEEHAKKRGATILAEVAGYGATGDAYHLTMPSPGGEGAQRAMKLALEDAGMNAADVGYVNAHATSTPAGDEVESSAIRGVFGDKVAVSATKSMTGHLLGAAGSLEAVISILALREGVLPPTINLDEPDETCALDYIPHKAREAKVTAVVSNSFGFGGTNAALAFR